MNHGRQRPAVAMLARSPFAEGKTRLTHGWLEADATALRWALLLDAAEAALALGWPLYVFLDPDADLAPCEARLRAEVAASAGEAGDVVAVRAQAGGDLGRRMVDAMRRTLDAGHDVVVLIGSDAPDVPASAIRAAVAALEHGNASRRLVLGPADDGGFYLVATTSPALEVFHGVTWSVDTVLRAVTEQATRAGWQVSLIEPWRDVDTPEDLRRLAEMNAATARRTRALARRLGLHSTHDGA